MRALWPGEPVTYAGRFTTITDVTLAPRPAQDSLDVWLGGSSPAALRRTGRLADGWLGSFVSPDELRDCVGAIVEAAEEAGRQIDDDHYGTTLFAAPDADEVPAEPDVERVLGGARRERHVGDRREASRVGHGLPGPERAHELDRLLRPGGALAARDAHRLGLPAQVDAEAERGQQAPAGERAHGGELLGEEHGVARRRDEHVRPELQLPRARRDGGERRQRRRAAERRRVGEPERVVAQRLDRLDQVEERPGRQIEGPRGAEADARAEAQTARLHPPAAAGTTFRASTKRTFESIVNDAPHGAGLRPAEHGSRASPPAPYWRDGG